MAIAGLAGALVILVLAAAAYAGAAPPFVATGDLAVIESYTLQATRGLAYLGPYSRYAWNHPGPLYFYCLAPVYAISGHQTAALFTVAGIINAAAFAAAVWVALRRAAGAGVAIALIGTLFIVRVGDSLTTGWNPHVLALPTMVWLVVAAALASGVARMLPWVALTASFLVQTHVGTVPAVFVVSTLAVAAFLAVLRNRTGSPVPEAARYGLYAAALVAVVWLPPVLEQLRGAPGNVTELWQFFVLDDHPGQPLTISFSTWAGLLGGVFSQDFGVTWSGTMRLGARPWTPWWAVAQVMLVALFAARSFRRGDRFRASLGMLLAAVSIAALWSITRIAGELVLHAVFWVSAIGAMNAAYVLDGAFAVVPRALSSSIRAFRVSPARRRAVATLTCAALCVVAIGYTVQQLRIRIERLNRPSAIEELTALRLWQTVDAHRLEHGLGKPLIAIQHPTWPVAAGVIVQLQKLDMPFALEVAWLPMFTDAFAARGDETSTITFARPDLRQTLLADPAQQEIAQRDGIHIFLGPARRGR